MTENEIPSIDLLNNAVQQAAKPATNHPRVLRTRSLMAEAIDQTLQYNLNRIDDLIDKLNGLKEKLIEGSRLAKAEIDGHYSYASEALDFADQIQARFLDIETNGHAQAETAAAAGVGSGELDSSGGWGSADDAGTAA